MISNIVRGGAQWWQLKENESSFVKMNQLVQQKYLFQIVKCYKWKEIRNSDHDINRKTSKTVSNFKDNYDSNNLTPRQMLSYASHSLSTQKIPESLVINLCTVFISTTDQHFFFTTFECSFFWRSNKLHNYHMADYTYVFAVQMISKQIVLVWIGKFIVLLHLLTYHRVPGDWWVLIPIGYNWLQLNIF